jgi:hypothetical protein
VPVLSPTGHDCRIIGGIDKPIIVSAENGLPADNVGSPTQVTVGNRTACAIKKGASHVSATTDLLAYAATNSRSPLPVVG